MLLYSCTKLHGVTKRNVMLLIFTDVVTLNCRVVLPWFPFPVNSTQSVCTQHCTKQTSTECYCTLRTVSDIQQTERHTPRLHIVCVCDTALLRLDSLISVTSSSNTNSYVRHENISPFISLLTSSNSASYTYQIDTTRVKATFSLKQHNLQVLKKS